MACERDMGRCRPARESGDSVLHFRTFKGFGFDFVPARDRKWSPGSDWVRLVTAPGGADAVRCFIFVLSRGLASILCRLGIVPKMEPGSDWVRLVTAPDGADAALAGAGSVLHFRTFKGIGFDFVPAPDRAESGAGLGLGSVLHFVSWRRLDSIFCACAAMVLSVPFKARDCDGCLPGCKVAGAEAPGDSVIRRLLKTGEIEVSQVGHRENWPPRNADRMK